MAGVYQYVSPDSIYTAKTQLLLNILGSNDSRGALRDVRLSTACGTANRWINNALRKRYKLPLSHSDPMLENAGMAIAWYLLKRSVDSSRITSDDRDDYDEAKETMKSIQAGDMILDYPGPDRQVTDAMSEAIPMPTIEACDGPSGSAQYRGY